MRIPYRQYIKSQAWIDRRRKYWIDHNGKYRCVVCGGLEKIHLHHRTYERIGNELDEDLVPLCEKCHKKTHELVRKGKSRLENAHLMVKMESPRRKSTKRKSKKFSRKKHGNKSPQIDNINPEVDYSGVREPIPQHLSQHLSDLIRSGQLFPRGNVNGAL